MFSSCNFNAYPGLSSSQKCLQYVFPNVTYKCKRKFTAICIINIDEIYKIIHYFCIINWVEMVDKTNLLHRERARDFLLGQRPDFYVVGGEWYNGGQATGPSSRHIKPLEWEQSKLRSIKVVLMPHKGSYEQEATEDLSKNNKVSRPKYVLSRPLPLTSPFWAGRVTQT